MPKRACPFGEYFPNQMKVHVGVKEISQGVNREKHMRDIHEKTLALMFASQQRVQHKPKMNLTTPTVPENVTNGHHPENGGMVGVATGGCDDDGWGCSQMELLAGQCRLDHHGRIIVGQTVQPKTKAQHHATPRCKTCSKVTLPEVSSCYACRSPLCTNCSSACLQCCNGFCSMCSMVNYDENFDRLFCLSCASQLN
ncbi:apoptosis regulatory protein Siva-like [Asterias amurensis]|uniref:apoptosis regulatory protein Siva-like n=1 Tax=Asterias amurensis TaxID=7602 RepID=UPI003AB60A71